MKKSFDREWRRILRPDETLIWSAAVSPSLIDRAHKQSRIGTIVFCCILLVIGGRAAWSAYDRLFGPDASLFLGSVSVMGAVACSIGVFFFAKKAANTAEASPFAAYGATEQRLIALDVSGDVADEIAKDEMEDVIWINDDRKDELLVLRANDDEGTRSFWISFIDEIEKLDDMIYKNYIRRKR